MSEEAHRACVSVLMLLQPFTSFSPCPTGTPPFLPVLQPYRTPSRLGAFTYAVPPAWNTVPTQPCACETLTQSIL